jgi:hypothetical protein
MSTTASSSIEEMITDSPAVARGTSWYARIIVLGAVSIVIGILWDISWHRTIGRDTFWTPAHMAIYLGGILGGCVGGWLIFRGTFLATESERSGMVKVLGLRGPFGAWFCVWGTLAMLTSAPFDDWWHNAYGLDVKILSPPHAVLALGMWAIVLGALFLVLREQNLAAETTASEASATLTPGALPGQWLFVLASGIILAMAAVFLVEESWPNQHRNQTFLIISCMTYPMYLVALSRASRFRFGATVIAGIYMLIFMLQGWILPQFTGHPKLGPVYNPVDYFVPLNFPMALVIPAFALDLLRWGIKPERGWIRGWVYALAAAVAFTGLFLATQWYLSEYLISPAAENPFFFSHIHWGYTDQRGDFRNMFWSESSPHRNTPLTMTGVWIALGLAFFISRIGLWLGNWMAKVKR